MMHFSGKMMALTAPAGMSQRNGNIFFTILHFPSGCRYFSALMYQLYHCKRHETNSWLWFWVYKSNQKFVTLPILSKFTVCIKKGAFLKII